MPLALSLALVLALAAGDAEPPRVVAARHAKLAAVRALFSEQHVAWPAQEILLRVFKKDAVLELWAGDGKSALALVKRYPICAQSGVLGPKTKQGDMQVPEGFYVVDRENPFSAYHLALHVDYPNARDRARGRAAGTKDLGGDIMVHGDCVTIGCIPLQDDPIEEVFLAVHDARAAGGRAAIHIFPARLDDDGLAKLPRDDAELVRFWTDELAPGYRFFEEKRRIPEVTVDKSGRYVLRSRE